jgi:DNA-binding response OmpR family regulator
MRVLLVTGRADLGEGLFLYLSERQLQVVGIVSAAADLAVTAMTTRPDLVLIDALLLEGDLCSAVEALRPAIDGLPVVLLAGRCEGVSPSSVGADALVSFDDPPAVLLAALHSVAPFR